MFHLDASNLY